MWPQDQLHRAPVNDFPPLWASSWGDDEYGLWADLTIMVTGNKVSLLNREKNPVATQEYPSISVTQKMRWIEPSQVGGFLMGSTQKERDNIQDTDIRKWANQYESEPFSMHVKNGFWLANTPCTQSFWTAVVGSNPSRFKNTPNAANLPVENIAFKDVKNKDASVVHFLKLLNQNLQSLSLNELSPNALIKADLPTEIEWEYACRADTDTAYWWGEDFDENRANTGYQLGKTTAVLEYPPNPWGLYDMHGNVWEWTSSNWKETLTDVKAKEDVSLRVMRGGSWDSLPVFARAAYRFLGHLGGRDRSRGLRLLLRSSS